MDTLFGHELDPEEWILNEGDGANHVHSPPLDKWRDRGIDQSKVVVLGQPAKASVFIGCKLSSHLSMGLSNESNVCGNVTVCNHDRLGIACAATGVLKKGKVFKANRLVVKSNSF